MEALKAEIKETQSIWHRQLGHLNMASVKSLESMADGIYISKKEKVDEICLPCIQGKQYKVYVRHELA